MSWSTEIEYNFDPGLAAMSPRYRTFTAGAVLPPTVAAGFITITDSVDTLKIYVDSENGSDSNDGLTEQTPKQSPQAARDMLRPGMPDHIYLKTGSVFSSNFNAASSGRSATEPRVITYYGDIADGRPIIHSGITNYNDPVSFHLYSGIAHIHDELDPTSPNHNPNAESEAIGFYGDCESIVWDDCLFSFSEFKISSGPGGTPTDIKWNRCIWTGIYEVGSSTGRVARPSNIYINDSDGIDILECVFDYGGWYPGITDAGANQLAHNMYIQYDNLGNEINVSNNIVCRAASHGIHGRPGGHYENNFFGRNAIGMQMGYDGHPLASSTFARAIDNVITEGWGMHDKGVNACAGTNTCTTAVWGLAIANDSTGQFTVADNIASQHVPVELRPLLTGSQFFGVDGDYTQNISFHWDNETEGDGVNYTDPTRTLGDYYQTLVDGGHITRLVNGGFVDSVPTGTDNFDKFMTLAKGRKLRQWDAVITSDAINTYIREGFVIV